MDQKPQLKNDEYLYRLLREGHITAFNEARERGESSDLTNCDFRGVDLRLKRVILKKMMIISAN